MSQTTFEIIHATCVSVDGHGLLIGGASGTGKSSLAFELLGMGATLVADDRTEIFVQSDGLRAKPPESIAGKIEARALGILEIPYLAQTDVRAFVDLDQIEKMRLPIVKTKVLLGVTIPCLWRVESPAFPSMLLHYLRYGRQDET